MAPDTREALRALAAKIHLKLTASSKSKHFEWLVTELAALAAAPSEAQGKPDEVGWVIERRCSFPVQYVCASSSGIIFTTDNLQAIRFCRREDANQIANILENEDIAIVEHMWCRP